MNEPALSIICLTRLPVRAFAAANLQSDGDAQKGYICRDAIFMASASVIAAQSCPKNPGLSAKPNKARMARLRWLGPIKRTPPAVRDK